MGPRKAIKTNSKRVSILISFLFLFGFANALSLSQQAWADTVRLENHSGVNYAGHMTVKRTCGDQWAYCMQPEADGPSSGTYTKHYVNAKNCKELIAVLYYGYGGPGFSRNKDLWPSTNWNGASWDSNDYFAMTHVLIARAYNASDLKYSHSNPLSGTTSSFKTWAKKNLWKTYSKMVAKYDEIPAWFKTSVYRININTGTQDIISYDPHDAGGIKIVKKETGTNKTLSGAKFTIYNSDKKGTQGTKVTTITSDSSGVAQTGKNDLLLGYYKVVETTSPANHAPTAPFVVKVSGDWTYASYTKYDQAFVSKTVTKKIAVSDRSHTPASCQAELMNGSKVVGTVTLSASNNWTYTWKDLNKYDNSGHEIAYSIRERGVSNGNITLKDTTGTNRTYHAVVNGFTITNIEYIDVPVEKIWDDRDNEYNTRPSSIEVELYRNGTATGAKKTLNASNGWKSTFTGQIYANDSAVPYVYSVKETQASLNANQGYVSSTVSSTKIRNTLSPRAFNVNKKWLTAPGDEVPTSVTVNLQYKVGSGNWADLKNKNGNVVSAQLSASNNWSASFTGLPKTSSNGQNYDYRAREVAVSPESAAENYTVSYSDTDMLTSITNISNRKISIPVHKVWNDNDDRFGYRPESCSVQLVQNGVALPDQIKTLDAPTWETTFDEVPYYNTETGERYEYSVKELTIPDYAVSIDGNSDVGFTVTNTGLKVKLNANKIWKDLDGNDSAAPENVDEITLQIYADGVPLDGKTISLGTANNWTAETDWLPAKDAADITRDIVYSLGETHVTEGYAAYSIKHDAYTIEAVNAKIKDDTDVSVEKVWNDNDNEEGLRPDHVDATINARSYDDVHKWSRSLLSFNITDEGTYKAPPIVASSPANAMRSAELVPGTDLLIPSSLRNFAEMTRVTLPSESISKLGGNNTGFASLANPADAESAANDEAAAIVPEEGTESEDVISGSDPNTVTALSGVVESYTKSYSYRLVISNDDNATPVEIREGDVVLGEHEGVSLLGFENSDELLAAKDYYSNVADFADVDTSFSIADTAADADVAEDGNALPEKEQLIIAAEEAPAVGRLANPLKDLESTEDEAESISVQHEDNRPLIALIDTGVSETIPTVGRMSVIGDDVNDGNGHGDKMARLILDENPDAKILSIKALDDGGMGSFASVYAAVSCAVEAKADIINLSLSGRAFSGSELLEDLIKKAIADDTVVTVAAGNGGYNASLFSPGRVIEAFTVGYAENGQPAENSNKGDVVDAYIEADSTSSATAIASGYLASHDLDTSKLMQSAENGLGDKSDLEKYMEQGWQVLAGSEDGEHWEYNGNREIGLDEFWANAPEGSVLAQAETTWPSGWTKKAPKDFISFPVSYGSAGSGTRRFRAVLLYKANASKTTDTVAYYNFAIYIDRGGNTGSNGYEAAAGDVTWNASASWGSGQTASKSGKNSSRVLLHTPTHVKLSEWEWHWTKQTSKVSVTINYSVTLKNKNKTSKGSFTLSIPVRTSYTVSYAANGGSSTPASQTKYYDVALALRGGISRASSNAGTFTVSFNGNGASNPAAQTSTKTANYTFKQWRASNGSMYNAGANYTANASTTMTAQWNTSYTTSQVTLPDITRSGFVFDGWWTAANGGSKVGNAGAKYTPSANTTFYAHWKSSTYNISYAGMTGASFGSSHPTSAAFGTQFTVNAPSRTGYAFAGWDITGMDSTTHTYGSATTTATQLKNCTATTFKNLWGTYGGATAPAGTVTFTAKWTGKYAEFDSSTGTLTFKDYVNGSNPPANGSTNGNITYYSGFENTTASTPSNCLWQAKSGSIKKVVFNTTVAPKSTAYWFAGCSQLESISYLTRINTANTVSMASMFDGCSKLAYVDVSSFDVTNVTNTSHMFAGCSNLISIFSAPNANWAASSKLMSSDNMFDGCSSIVGGVWTDYSDGVKNKAYARVDGLGQQRGYFIAKGSSQIGFQSSLDPNKTYAADFYCANSSGTPQIAEIVVCDVATNKKLYSAKFNLAPGMNHSQIEGVKIPGADSSVNVYAAIKLGNSNGSDSVLNTSMFGHGLFYALDSFTEVEVDPNQVPLSDANEWGYKWEKMKLYTPEGHPIVYSVDEPVVPEGYRKTVIGNAEQGFTITNSKLELQLDIPVKKIWDDDNFPGDRTPSVKMRLYRDGVAVSDDEGGLLILDENNNWTGTFAELPRYRDTSGEDYTEENEYDYTVEEEPVPENYTVSKVGDKEIGFTFTNKAMDRTNIPVNKIWKGEREGHPSRPEAVTVRLLADGEDTGKQLVLNDANNWSGVFQDLLLGPNYTVEELHVDNYATNIEGSAYDGFSIENVYDRTSIDVNKTWENASRIENQVAGQPKSVSVRLLRDGQDTGLTAELNEANGWHHTFENLEKYSSADGSSLYDYSVEEVHVDGYDSNVSGNMEVGFTLNNTARIKVPVSKIWNDNENSDGIRPASVTVSLLRNGEPTGETIELNETNGWKGIFQGEQLPSGSYAGLPMYLDGVKCDYTIEEQEIPEDVASGGKYTPAISGDIDNFTILNNHVPRYTEIRVQKIWDDADDQDRIRPRFINVDLVRDGDTEHPYMSAVLDESNNWAYTFEKVLKYKDGSELEESEYEIVEHMDPAIDDEYTKIVGGDKETGFILINTHTPRYVYVDVEKRWEDGDNLEGKRPSQLILDLVRDNDETVIETKTISPAPDGTWKHVFGPLPLSNGETGDTYSYSVVERMDSETEQYYTLSAVSGDQAEGYSLVNTYIDEKIFLHVSKEWNVQNFSDVTIPQELTFRVLRNGHVVEGYENVTLTAANGWKSGDIGPLPKYDRETGQEYAYDVMENAMAGFTPKVYADEDDPNGFTIVNTPNRTVSVQKVWDDNDNVGLSRPDSVKFNLMSRMHSTCYESSVDSQRGMYDVSLPRNQMTVLDGTISRYPSQDVTIKIISFDDSDEGTVVDSKTVTTDASGRFSCPGFMATREYTSLFVTLEKAGAPIPATDISSLRSYPEQKTTLLYTSGIASETSEWKCTWEELPRLDAVGELIEYWVEEDSPANGYTLQSIEPSTDDAYAFTAKNKLVTSIHVEKEWQDNNSSSRPSSVVVNLKRDGQVVDTKNLDSSSNWSCDFDNLVWRAPDGHDYTYTVDEQPVPGYSKTITGNISDGFKIINSTDVANVPVDKVWKDSGHSELRPASVNLKLIGENRYAGQWKAGEPASAISDIGSSVISQYLARNQAMQSKASRIEYTFSDTASGEVPVEFDIVLETPSKSIRQTVKTVPGGSTSGSIDVSDGSIDLASTALKLEASDGNRIYESRIESGDLSGDIAIVCQDEYGAKTISASDNWHCVFENLAKYDESGQEIHYVVVEDPNEDYTPSLSGTPEEGYVLTNTLNGMTIPVRKFWNDGNDNDGIRPASVTVHLLQNGVKMEPDRSIVLSEDNQWQGQFEDIAKYDEFGNTYSYTVSEDILEGYTPSISGTVETGFDITNTHESSLKVKITKKWDDASNLWDSRPYEFEVLLYRGIAGEAPVEYARQIVPVIKDSDEQTLYFDELPKCDEQGRDYIYSVVETPMPSYEASVEESGDNIFTITNAYKPVRKASAKINVVKKWNDPGHDDERPAFVTFVLLRDGVECARVQASSFSDYNASFSDLPYDDGNGHEYTYTLKEEDAEKYSSEIEGDALNGFLVTNTRLVDVPVRKHWLDGQNLTGHRPQSVTFTLTGKARGEQEVITRQLQLTEEDGWEGAFTGLPCASPNGNEYKYDVEETPVEGYDSEKVGNVNEATSEGFDFYNTEKCDIVVDKEWEDYNNAWGRRPAEITLSISRERQEVVEGAYATKTVVPDENGKWCCVFTDLPKYMDEDSVTPIDWIITEAPVNNYRYSVSKSDDTHYLVTNVQQEIMIPVEKTWDDEDNANNRRPSTVTFEVSVKDPAQQAKVSIPEASKRVVVDQQGDWKGLFTKLPAHDSDGKEIEYDINEVGIPAYYHQKTKEGDMFTKFSFENEEIKIVTSAENKDNKTKYIADNSDSNQMVVQDTVTHKGLYMDRNYELRATLKYLDGTTVPNATGTREFRPVQSNGSITVDIPVSPSQVAYGEFVVFEELVDLSVTPNETVAVHEDLRDPAQTMRNVRILTSAIDKTSDDVTNEDKYITGENSTISDTISYEGLIPNHSYKVVGTLMDKSSNKAIVDRSGNPVSADKTFDTSDPNGSTVLEIPFDLKNVDGSQLVDYGNIVVFETLYDNDDTNTVIATHHIIEDASQTVHHVDIGTTATNPANNESKYFTNDGTGKVTLKDTVAYKGFVPGHRYRLETVLMNVADNAPASGTETQSHEFEAKASDGDAPGEANSTESVSYEYNLADLATGKYVFFEKVYDVETGKLIAVHEDLNDEAQTLNYIKVWTDARDSSDNDRYVVAKNNELTDTVTYNGAFVGREYKLSATLMEHGPDGSLHPTDMHGETVFTATAENGSQPVKIPITTSSMTPGEYVVFEQMFDTSSPDTVIARHEEAQDLDQTINYVELRTWATDNADEDKFVSQDVSQSAQEIHDTVTYKGVRIGETYTLRARLVDKDGHDIEGANAEVTFTAEQMNSEQGIVIPFDVNKTASDEVVVYEEMYTAFDNAFVADHAELEDMDQRLYVVRVSTTATNKDSGSKYVADNDGSNQMVIKDMVKYEGLLPGRTYSVEATLHYRNGSVIPGFTGKSQFDPTAKNGEVEVDIPVQPSLMNYGEIVVYEKLIDTTTSKVVAIHEDPNDAEQIMRNIRILTSAVDKAEIPEMDADKYITDDNAIIKDTISYDGLEMGREYKVVGTLMDKSTNQAVLGRDGQPVSASSVFTADDSGKTVLEIPLDLRNADGSQLVDYGNIVVFETLYDNKDTDTVIATHHIIEDSAQTVRHVDIKTIATNPANNENKHFTNDGTNKVTLKDTVIYNGLEPGHKYKLETTLMNKATGEIAPGTSTTTDFFTAEASASDAPGEANSKTSVEHEYDISAFSTGEYVFFERLYDDETGKLIATHEDLEDKDQTVNYVEIGTYVKDNSDGDRYISGDKAEVTDYVEFHGLQVGSKYRVEGKLIDRLTGKPAMIENENGKMTPIEASSEFEVPAEATSELAGNVVSSDGKGNGKVQVPFSFDTSKLAYGEYIFFEYLYDIHNDGEGGGSTPGGDDQDQKTGYIAKHEDLSDENQVLNYVRIDTTAFSADNEDKFVYEEDVKVIDRVHMQGLKPNHAYALVGAIMNKETGEMVADDNGVLVQGRSEFYTGALYSGYVDVVFDLTGTKSLPYGQFVLTETLQDIADQQSWKTAHPDEVGNASDTASTKPAEESPEVASKVDESGSASSGQSSKDDSSVQTDDKASENKINAEARDSRDVLDKLQAFSSKQLLMFAIGDRGIDPDDVPMVEIAAQADAKATAVEPESALEQGANSKIPAYSDVISEKNLDNSFQMFNHVGIRTIASDAADGDKYLDADTVVNDLVLYKGLEPGKDYRLAGTLMNKVSQEPAAGPAGGAATGYTDFTVSADSRDGEITVSIPVSFTGSKDPLVAFEKLSYKDDDDSFSHVPGEMAESVVDSDGYKLIGEHKDFSDEDQTVFCVKIGTVAHDAEDGDDNVAISPSSAIDDLVMYEGLEKTDYVLRTYIYDKATDSLLVLPNGTDHIDTTFTSDGDGSVNVKIDFDSTTCTGHELVVFEEVYSLDMQLVSAHKDKDDANQTVAVDENDDVGAMLDTGDSEWPFIAGILAAIAFASIVIVYMSRNARRIRRS